LDILSQRASLSNVSLVTRAVKIAMDLHQIAAQLVQQVNITHQARNLATASVLISHLTSQVLTFVIGVLMIVKYVPVQILRIAASVNRDFSS
jgi:hypothetical protein